MEESGKSGWSAERAARYDGHAPKSIPGYEAMHRMACATLKHALPGAGHVLVIGAGTGKELTTLGEANPDWRFTGVDPSGDMLAVAREALAANGMAERAELCEGRVQDLPEEAAFDGATAVLVMHFLPDDGTMLDFLRAIAARLRPGAPLILVSQYGARPSPAFDETIAAWKHYQLGMGMAAGEVDERMERRLGANHYVPEARILELLQEAGFAGAAKFFQAFVVGGWSARRG